MFSLTEIKKVTRRLCLVGGIGVYCGRHPISFGLLGEKLVMKKFSDETWV